MASDWMTQKLLGMYLDDGIYYTSLLKFRDVYRTNRDLVCQKLDELAPLGVSYTKPRGGVYVWCRLPDGVDSKQFIRRAYNMGVTLIPGYVFTPARTAGATISASTTPTSRASGWSAAWRYCAKRWKKNWRSNWHTKWQNH